MQQHLGFRERINSNEHLKKEMIQAQSPRLINKNSMRPVVIGREPISQLVDPVPISVRLTMQKMQKEKDKIKRKWGISINLYCINFIEMSMEPNVLPSLSSQCDSSASPERWICKLIEVQVYWITPAKVSSFQLSEPLTRASSTCLNYSDTTTFPLLLQEI